jgi:hypothetical protein
MFLKAQLNLGIVVNGFILAPQDQQSVPLSRVMVASLQFRYGENEITKGVRVLWGERKLVCSLLHPDSMVIRCPPHYYCVQVDPQYTGEQRR